MKKKPKSNRETFEAAAGEHFRRVGEAIRADVFKKKRQKPVRSARVLFKAAKPRKQRYLRFDQAASLLERMLRLEETQKALTRENEWLATRVRSLKSEAGRRRAAEEGLASAMADIVSKSVDDLRAADQKAFIDFQALSERVLALSGDSTKSKLASELETLRRVVTGHLIEHARARVECWADERVRKLVQDVAAIPRTEPSRPPTEQEVDEAKGGP